MKSVGEIKAKIGKWFDDPGRLDRWLRAEAATVIKLGPAGGEGEPGGLNAAGGEGQGDGFKDLAFNLKPPTEKEAMGDFKAVSEFVRGWKAWEETKNSAGENFGQVVWEKRGWASLGQQALPVRVNFRGFSSMAQWVGRLEDWTNLRSRYLELAGRWPGAVGVLRGHLRELAGYGPGDFERLLAVLAWLEKNPNSSMYLRQLPIGGLDTKWLEKRKAIAGDLVGVILGRGGDLYSRCGLLEPKSLVRVRLLDPALRDQAGGLGYFMAPAKELAKLFIKPNTVFVVENSQTGLAFEDLNGSVLVFGHGYGLEFISQVPWLRKAKRHFYWGDIDRHGFGILSKARERLPGLVSFLMDEATLLDNKELWGQDDDKSSFGELNLTFEEASLFKALVEDRYGERVRFEQERLAWDVAWRAIRKLV
ncbi:MAG: DUF2220 family protein [Deltaproteobacteria bacterium]|nr:DUF2220 family protein [Deltaproteobacteria bacterium]